MLGCDYLLDCGILIPLPYSRSAIPPLVAALLQGVLYEGRFCNYAGFKPRTVVFVSGQNEYSLILPRIDLLDALSQTVTVLRLNGEKYDKVFLNSLLGDGL